jgi:uracil-DNA glycosylase family 4
VQQSGFVRAHGAQSNTLRFLPPANLQHAIEQYDACARCHLCASRMSVVHYKGNPDAKVVFLGEAPGREENNMGEPFVGPSGKLQDVANRNNGIDSHRDLFWMNVLGCRPADHWQKDRPPTAAELSACSERVWMMLSVVRPRVVVCLGEIATKFFFDEKPDIWSFARLEPQGHPEDWIMVGHAYHPAYLARVIGVPASYKQYAAQRTFYGILKNQLPSLTKVSAWRFHPRYAFMQEPEVAWHSV